MSHGHWRYRQRFRKSFLLVFKEIPFSVLTMGGFGEFGSFQEGSHFHIHGWLRGSVVERRSSASVLSLSCARPVVDG